MTLACSCDVFLVCKLLQKRKEKKKRLYIGDFVKKRELPMVIIMILRGLHVYVSFDSLTYFQGPDDCRNVGKNVVFSRQF